MLRLDLFQHEELQRGSHTAADASCLFLPSVGTPMENSSRRSNRAQFRTPQPVSARRQFHPSSSLPPRFPRDKHSTRNNSLSTPPPPQGAHAIFLFCFLRFLLPQRRVSYLPFPPQTSHVTECPIGSSSCNVQLKKKPPPRCSTFSRTCISRARCPATGSNIGCIHLSESSGYAMILRGGKSEGEIE